MLSALHTLRRDGLTLLKDLTSDGKGWILLTVSVGWFLSIGVRFAYPALLPFFQDAFGMDHVLAGALLTGIWMAYALGQFPGGLLGDRVGEGNILVVSMLVSSGALLVIAASVDVLTLFVGTVAFGLATSLYGPTRFTIFTDIYASRAGTAIGFTMAAGSVGNAVFPAVGVVVSTYLSWRLGLGMLIPMFLVIAVALRVVVPSRTSERRRRTGSVIGTARAVLAGLARDGIPSVVAAQIVLTFVGQGVLGFLPIYLIEVKEFTPTTASVLYGLYFAIGVPIQMLAGASSDRFGSRRTLVYLTGTYFVALVVLRYTHSVVDVLLLIVFLSHKNGTGVVNNTVIAAALPDEIKGSGLGLARTGWILCASVSPLVVGIFASAGMLEHAYLLLAGLAGVGTLLALFVPDR